MTRLSLLGTQLKVLRPLQGQMLLSLASLTFQTKNNLTSSLGLLVEHGLGLTTETHLFGVVTPFSLSEVGSLAGLVLSHLVNLVLTALLAGTVCLAFFGYVHHFWILRNGNDEEEGRGVRKISMRKSPAVDRSHKINAHNLVLERPYPDSANGR